MLRWLQPTMIWILPPPSSVQRSPEGSRNAMCFLIARCARRYQTFPMLLRWPVIGCQMCLHASIKRVHPENNCKTKSAMFVLSVYLLKVIC